MSRLGTALIAMGLAAGVTGAAQAAPQAAYPVAGVDIVNAAAQVHVIAEDRTDVTVSIVQDGRLPPVTAHVAGARLVIDGGLDRRIRGCNSWHIGLASGRDRHATVSIWGVGNIPVENLPTVTVRVPRHLDVSAGGAVFGEISASAGGNVRFSGCGRLAIGPAGADLDLVQTGSGDVDIASIAGALHAQLTGSGDLRALNATGGVRAELIGSGDLTIGAMAGPLVAKLNGSGDLTAPDGASAADLDLRGSGDVRVGAVNGPLRAHVNGSGDLVVASVRGGAADLSLEGSGDLSVNGGAANHVGARLDGSGDLRFRGAAQSLDADLGGSGDIYVAEAGPARTIHDHGSGDVHVGN